MKKEFDKNYKNQTRLIINNKNQIATHFHLECFQTVKTLFLEEP